MLCILDALLVTRSYRPVAVHREDAEHQRGPWACPGGRASLSKACKRLGSHKRCTKPCRQTGHQGCQSETPSRLQRPLMQYGVDAEIRSTYGNAVVGLTLTVRRNWQGLHRAPVKFRTSQNSHAGSVPSTHHHKLAQANHRRDAAIAGQGVGQAAAPATAGASCGQA